MLGDHNRRTVRGQPGEHRLQRLDPASRRPHRDQPPRRPRPECRHGRPLGRRGRPHAPPRHAGGCGRQHLPDQLLADEGQFLRIGGRGFAHALHRTKLERLQRRLGPRRREGRHHHNRCRPQPHDLFQKTEPVHLRHLDIEGDDIGIQRLDHLARREGFGRFAHHRDARIGRQQFPQHPAHQQAVINNQNANRARRHQAFR